MTTTFFLMSHFVRFFFIASSPCFTLCEAADNIGESGPLYCIAACCGLGCCALGALGEQVAKKRGIKDYDLAKSCGCALLNCCTCYSCRVVNESRLYKANPGASAPNAEAMTRN